MLNITRYDPFSLSRTDPFADLDDLFKGFFVRPVAFDGQAPMQIKMDVKENNGTYTVHADIPGVKKEDIHVKIEGNQISISAEIKSSKEVKEGDNVLRAERYHGKVARSFALDTDIDESRAEAKYSDGVLELILPKRIGTEGRTLSIQ